MKKLMVVWGLLVSMLFSPQLNAQVNVNININSQPVWGPVGYDYVEYYYLPDIEVYYSVVHRKYIYFSGGRWIWVTALPASYRNYNIYKGYKVVINQPEPYKHFETHKVKYAKYKNYHGKQTIIKNSKAKKSAPGRTVSPQKSSPQKKSASPAKTTPVKKAPAKGGGNKNPGKGGGHGKGHSN